MGLIRLANMAAAAALLMLGASTAGAQVHRCTGPDGKLVYSDAPCAPQSSGGAIKLQENSLDTRMEREHNERYLQGRQQEAQGQQMDAAQAANAAQADARRDSPACRLAIRNANTQSSTATPAKIDNDRAEAIRECGFNPWPGKTASEIDAENRRSKAIERAARRRPGLITTCDTSGCWDTLGNRYNGTGRTLFRTDGQACIRTGNALECR
ncbi:DUF4124 domain-containing protein [Ottowia sp.]|uniref:DUF4124 domain-containing protein n=1 Tax=Ottowia sp. TaxID=1898956 RepID=UPI003C72D3AF